MKHFILLLIFSLFLFITVKAVDNYELGARAGGVANASVTFADVWSAYHNQAGLGMLKNISAGAYIENRFLISDLSLKGFAVAVPSSKLGTFALSWTMYGGSLYNEKKLGIGYGKKLSDKFSVGIQLDYLSTNIAEDYGSRNAFAVELGILAEPIKNLKLAAHVFNPNRAKAAEYADERIPVILKFGASYQFSEKILFSAEEEKDIDQDGIFKAGLEYHVMEVLYLRAGIASNPTLSSFGFGLKFSEFTIDMATSWYQDLGFSPQFSLAYTFK
jgi:hypothetical protein